MITLDTFPIDLLDNTQNPSALQVWQSGTLKFAPAEITTLVGTLTLPGVYPNRPIPFSTTVVSTNWLGTVIQLFGASADAEMTASLDYITNSAFTYNGNSAIYIAGVMNVFDLNARSSHLCIVHGVLPA